jgi:hypothetical protein
MAPRVLWPVLLALGVWLTAEPIRAQDPADTTSYSKDAVFRIPFNTDAAARLKQIQLYVSTDQGQTWKQVEAVTPDRRWFQFTAPRDGLYWFAVRTVDVDNRAYPPQMDNVRPGLKVLVDTQPPRIRLRSLPPRDAEVGVEWEVSDENPLPGGIRLEYRLPGNATWMPVAVDLPGKGERYWRPGTNGPVEVRLLAKDRALNEAEEKTTLSPGPGGSAGQPPAAPADTGLARPQEPNVRLVNSTRIALNYEIKEKGPSGVSTIELWYTQDPRGRIWTKYPKEGDGKTPPPFIVEVNGEGLYGFTLVVRSGVGLGDRPPEAGDQPQVWVEVDLTKPVVRLGQVEVGRGAESGRLTIHWTASDKNFGTQPITLSYAEQTAGPWKTIAANVDNNGRYIWQMPADVPYQFYLRVEAMDRAGNVGSDQSQRAVNVDLSQPKGIIVNVEPAPK